MNTQKQNPPIIFKMGDRVRIIYVPSAVKNVEEGMTGTVISQPRIQVQMVQIEVRLDDKREIWWLQDYLEKIEDNAPVPPKSSDSEPELVQTINAIASIYPTSSILIDSEFKSLIPPLSNEERSQLEANLLREGCRDRLVVWKGHNILLDGHNRYELCTKHGISFDVVEIDLPSREAAINWIIDLQLGRRNLTPEAISYLRGKRYNHEKLSVKNPTGQNQYKEVGGKSCPQPKTAEKLADDYKVSPRTIKNDAKFAADVDTIASVVGNSIRPDILSRNAKLTKKETKELANLAKETPDLVKEAFSDKKGEILDVVEIIKRRVDERANIPFPFHIGEVCIIQPQGDKELRQYKDCWCVVKEIYEFSCLVSVWDSEIQVAEKNLKSLEYTEQQKEEKRAIALRLANIITVGGMEEAVIASNLRFFGSLQRSYLTETEEGMLSWIEQKLGING